MGEGSTFHSKAIPDGLAAVSINAVYKNKGSFSVNSVIGQHMKKGAPQVKLATLQAQLSLWPLACMTHNATAEKAKKGCTAEDMWD